MQSHFSTIKCAKNVALHIFHMYMHNIQTDSFSSGFWLVNTATSWAVLKASEWTETLYKVSFHKAAREGDMR